MAIFVGSAVMGVDDFITGLNTRKNESCMERGSATIERQNIGKVNEARKPTFELINRFAFANRSAVKDVLKARH
jgi:hypothetical protein